MRAASRFAAVIIAGLGLLLPWTGLQAGNSSPEQVLFQAANRDRVTRGLPPLVWSDSLASAARRHAALLAQRSTLSHQLPGEPGLPARALQAGARFSTIAENIAEGPTAERIHAQWMKSPHHRANLLDPQLDSVGIAVAERHGILFAVEDFSQAAGRLSLGEQERLVDSRLRSRGLRILGYTDDARRTCALDNGYAGAHPPDFVVHYATTNPADLPDLLEKRIESGRYRSAAAGACAPNRKTGFSMYRLAVMLYQ